MLSFSCKRIYYFVSDKLIFRNLRQVKLRPNPGLDQRINAFEKEDLPPGEDIEEFLEESESDFQNLGGAYKNYEHEQRHHKQQLRRLIVKRKYFNESTPNLLTWSEKEQIRHLNSTDPNEWTPERIAESFPITAAVAKKILKYPWKPATEQRIARHDQNAMRNWKELEEGTLDVSPELREHLLKFSKRTIPPLSKKSIKIDSTEAEKMGEFQAIVDRCASKDTNKDENSTTINEEDATSEFNKYKIDKKRMTLEELTDKIREGIKQGKNVDVPDKMIADAVDFSSVPTMAETNNFELESSTEPPKSMISFDSQDLNKKEVQPYPERIRIPKSAWKRGATYKVDDCYYSDDGRFLYRVIGMKN